MTTAQVCSTRSCRHTVSSHAKAEEFRFLGSSGEPRRELKLVITSGAQDAFGPYMTAGKAIPGPAAKLSRGPRARVEY